MKKIIITGGSGFIGSNLVNYFLKKNYFVINIDKLSYSGSNYNLNNLKTKNYFFVKSDINNRNIVIKTLKTYKPSVVFNLAAETHVDRSIDGPGPFIHSNINGVFNLLEAIKFYNSRSKEKTKLIHVSTDEVYGDILKGRSHENFPYKPSSPYAASKAASDHLVSSYVRTYGIPAIVTNCSNNYGPKQHPEKLIPKLIYNILNNKSLPIYGDGKNSREWIYVEDHCEALIKVFQKGKIGEFYNIGSNKNLNNLEICKALIKIAKKNYLVASNVKIQFVKDRPGHDIRYALDSKKIIKKLRWKTKISFEKGLEKTFLWYLNNNNYYKSISRMDIVKRLGKND